MLLGLNHANISTTRLAETVAFYTDILGMRVGPRPAFSFGGAWLYVGDQPVVHLVERAQARPEGVVDHVAFTVADFDAALAMFEKRGIPYQASDIPSNFGRQCFVRDPNGVRIELTEPGPGPA
jgi:catechol 2,3-dioxygenase-like lactoylglutathione lyase family enzyme